MTTLTQSSLTGLPLDVFLDSLLPLLPLHDLLSLAATCHALHTLIHSTQSIWRSRVEAEFRFPAGATGRLDGFQTLYRKLSKPQVWVWGQFRNSRMGLDRHERLIERVLIGFDQVPTPLRLEAVESKALVDLQAGGWSFHGLSVDGHIWCWGTMDAASSNWNVRLNSLVYACQEQRERPERLEVDGLPTFRSISCGRQHVLALADDGQLYEWYSWKRIARLVSTPWKALTQISAGWNLSGALTKSGEVHIWKEASRTEVEDGLNGMNTQEEDNAVLFELDSADRVIKTPNLPDQVIRIALGEDFIICLTESAKVYKLDLSLPSASIHSPASAAENFRPVMRAAFLDGRRAWEYLQNFSEPDNLDRFLSKALPDHVQDQNYRPKITHISAQYRSFVSYSVAAEGNGNSFVFMGTKESGAKDDPVVIPGLQKRGVIQVSLGDHHFLALLSNGQVLSWGSYSAGALGLGHPQHPHRPLFGSPPQDASDYRQGIPNPTALQSFSGTDGCWEGDEVMTRRYVFSITAAGWHSGCLAFGLDEGEDLDQGLDVILEVEGSNSRKEEVSRPVLNPNGRVRFRIGYPGRFMRGRGRGVLDHHGFAQTSQAHGAMNHEEAETGGGETNVD
ncbi:hypothetical protein CROQUDRAFT_48734 [Cronartium quercuum f. sp. fusiforme G11]|uniref:F-box domain-containing protein n=1 Tax=Cronartium quercuum f. sp. fusiforme G11 TaxID=708437 RepID=A0A9P6NG49_9BASI|nr:hypothetical protein CROQUDRAFT_48734 [Cronartium quercuum f. sp. fusiforme G11]